MTIIILITLFVKFEAGFNLRMILQGSNKNSGDEGDKNKYILFILFIPVNFFYLHPLHPCSFSFPSSSL